MANGEISFGRFRLDSARRELRRALSRNSGAGRTDLQPLMTELAAAGVLLPD